MPKQTPEGKVKDKVKAILAKYGDAVYYRMPVLGGFGRPELDFYGCCGGKYFSIETKKNEDTDATPQQKQIGRETETAHGKTFLIQGTDDPELVELDKWLWTQTHSAPSLAPLSAWTQTPTTS